MATGVVVVLFADVVGSTELQTRAGDAQFDALRRALMDRLDAVIEQHHGTLIKRLGDGVMVTFGSAVDALGAADEMRAVARDPMRLRIGLSAGDVIAADDDIHGTPVVEAARLCSAAADEQVLCSDVVVMLARGHADRFQLEPVGALELKGLGAPVNAFELLASARAAAFPFPSALEAGRRNAFVGRSEARAALVGAIDMAAAGTRRLALVSGEPGVGKTHLVAETSSALHDEGATVLCGRCVEELVAPFAPWIEIVEAIVADAPADLLTEHVARCGPTLVRVVPALGRAVGEEPPPPIDQDSERRRLADAIDDLLGAVAGDEPLVVVLDDVHWADAASLAVLGHVLRSTRPGRMALVATYRDTDLDRTHPLAAMLGDLHRTGKVDRVDLTGLRRAEVSDLVQALAEQTPDPELVDALLAETEGNPFFVVEVLRHLAESGAYQRNGDGQWVATRSLSDLGLPQGVREVVGRRLSRLSEAANKALTAASVIGATFWVDVLELAVARDMDADALDDALDEARRAGLVADAGRGLVAFAHALVRQTLLDELSSTRRTRLHWRVGEAIAARRPKELDAIAFHLAEGVLAGDAALAVDAALAAGADALARFLPEQATLQFERVRTLLEEAELDDPERRLRAYRGLGESALGLLDPPRWAAAFLVAAEIAAAQEWWDRFVDIVSDAASLPDIGVLPTDRLRELIDRAMSHTTSDEQRAWLLLADSNVRYAAGDFLGAVQLTDAGTELARRLDEPALVVAAHGNFLRNRHAVDPAPYHRAWLRELQRAAERIGSSPPAARRWTLGPLDQEVWTSELMLAMQVGDRDTVDDRLARTEESGLLLARFRAPYWASALAGLDGRLDDAVVHIDTLLQRFPEYGVAQICHAGVHASVPFEQHDDFAAAEPRWREMTDRFPGDTAATIRLWNVRHTFGAGLVDEIIRDVEATRRVFRATHPSAGSCANAQALAESAAFLGIADWAHEIEDLLEAHRGAMLVSSFGWVLFPADTALGQLHLACSRFDRAVTDLESGVEFARRFRATYLELRSRYWLGRALVARDDVGDRDAAVKELSVVASMARECGLTFMEHRADEVLERA